MEKVLNNIDYVKLKFLLEVYPKIKLGKIVPNIKFVFDSYAISSFYMLKKYVNDEKNLNKLNNSIDLLKKDNDLDDDLYAIKIENSEIFFKYLMEISNAMYFREVKYYGSANNELSDIILYIWLRMSPNDFLDVNKFLQLQLSFIYNDDILSNGIRTWENIGSYDRYQVSMLKYLNDLYYESDTSICMRLEYNNKYYVLPSIFYGITEEEGKKVCYLYGIQNNERLIKNNNIDISDELKKLNKGKNNHGTFISFMIALEKFIEILSNEGITTIKVPLLQVLNYDFHILLSDKEKENLIRNFPNAYVLEELINSGISNDETEKYKNYKKIWYSSAVDKEDEISKRKTEGLINIFRRLEDQKGIINIKSIPFIDDENLIIEIFPKQEKVKSNR